jgi:hypothetical protein
MSFLNFELTINHSPELKRLNVLESFARLSSLVRTEEMNSDQFSAGATRSHNNREQSSTSMKSRSRSPESNRHHSGSSRHYREEDKDDDRSRGSKSRRDRSEELSEEDDYEDRRARKKERRRHSKKREKRDKDEDEKDDKRLPDGVEEISTEDYFIKSNELKVWLNEEKGKRLDQLSGDDARSYFKKFVKSWNRGRLAGNLTISSACSAQCFES